MLRLLALCLGLALAVPAGALDLQNLSAADRAALDAEIRAYIVAHPEVLVEAMNALEAKQAAQQADADAGLVKANRSQIEADGYSWVAGNPQGDVTLVEFLDYRCPYCRKAYDAVGELVKGDGKIRFVVKEFPILGPQSELASRFAVAVMQADGPEAYGKVHDALMTFRGEITPQSLGMLATKFGLDGQDLLGRMNSEAVSKVLADNRALGEKLAISGTPTFVLADQLIRGYLPEDQLKAMVAKVREE